MNRARMPIHTRLWLLPVVALVLTACSSAGNNSSQSANRVWGRRDGLSDDWAGPVLAD